MATVNVKVYIIHISIPQPTKKSPVFLKAGCALLPPPPEGTATAGGARPPPRLREIHIYDASTGAELRTLR